MATYTFTIYDANPNQYYGGAWDHMTDVEVEADDPTDAAGQVRARMKAAASELDRSDGYDVGDVLYANIWHADGKCVSTPTYTITEEDLL